MSKPSSQSRVLNVAFFEDDLPTTIVESVLLEHAEEDAKEKRALVLEEERLRAIELAQAQETAARLEAEEVRLTQEREEERIRAIELAQAQETAARLEAEEVRLAQERVAKTAKNRADKNGKRIIKNRLKAQAKEAEILATETKARLEAETKLIALETERRQKEAQELERQLLAAQTRQAMEDRLRTKAAIEKRNQVESALAVSRFLAEQEQSRATSSAIAAAGGVDEDEDREEVNGLKAATTKILQVSTQFTEETALIGILKAIELKDDNIYRIMMIEAFKTILEDKINSPLSKKTSLGINYLDWTERLISTSTGCGFILNKTIVPSESGTSDNIVKLSFTRNPRLQKSLARYFCELCAEAVINSDLMQDIVDIGKEAGINLVDTPIRVKSGREITLAMYAMIKFTDKDCSLNLVDRALLDFLKTNGADIDDKTVTAISTLSTPHKKPSHAKLSEGQLRDKLKLGVSSS